MTFATSNDGTRIFYQSIGSGPPLVAVHGSGSSHKRWQPLLPHLKDHVTFHAVERRGRGKSEDGDVYAMEREFEDVASVVDALEPSVALLGFSSGAIYAIEAVLPYTVVLTDFNDQGVHHQKGVRLLTQVPVVPLLDDGVQLLA